MCERTFKYFQAIAHHCWLVSYQWVEDCITAHEILPEVICYPPPLVKWVQLQPIDEELIVPLMQYTVFMAVRAGE